MDSGVANRRVIFLTGSMGAGKTLVLSEISDLLAARGIVHAAIDLDALHMGNLPVAAQTRVEWLNVECVIRNYREAGVDRFVIATALENVQSLERLTGLLGHTDVHVCRLRAPISIMEDRVRQRDCGFRQTFFVQRVAALEAALDAVSLENLTVWNDNRPITDVAEEVLKASEWIA